MKIINNKKEEIEENTYDEDIKKTRELLFYRKEEVLKYINKKVPYVSFSRKYMIIQDISFVITKSGKVFIHLYTKDSGIILITLKDNEPIMYTLENLVMTNLEEKYTKKIIRKTKEILKVYLELLESLKEKYPNENIYFGLVSYEFIEKIIIPENSFSKKLS